MEETFQPGAGKEFKEPAKNGNGANGGRKKVMTISLIVLGIIGLIVGGRWLAFRLSHTTSDDAQVDADVLPISSKISGKIVRILVSEGNSVKKGQLLAGIDPTDYRLAYERASASLDSAKREMEKAEANLDLVTARTKINLKQSESGVNQAEDGFNISSTQQSVNGTKLEMDLQRAAINLKRVEQKRNELNTMARQAATDLDRVKSLYSNGVVSKSQLDQAQTAADAAADRLAQVEMEKTDAQKQVDVAQSNIRAGGIDNSQVQIAKQNLNKASLNLELSRAGKDDIRSARLTVIGLRSKVKELTAVLKQARVALNETEVRSPVDGIVAKKASQMFEFVQAGKPVFFVIDSSGKWITANIEETNLDKIEAGSTAEVSVDALGGKKFKGKVKSIGAATNARFSLIPQSNPSGQFIKVTQRIPVKIRLSGDLSELKPGMNVVVVIDNKP